MAEERHPYCYIDVGTKRLPWRWMAPERRSTHRDWPSTTLEESLWSLGVTLWEVSTGCQVLPFHQVYDQALMETPPHEMPQLSPIELLEV